MVVYNIRMSIFLYLFLVLFFNSEKKHMSFNYYKYDSQKVSFFEIRYYLNMGLQTIVYYFLNSRGNSNLLS